MYSIETGVFSSLPLILSFRVFFFPVSSGNKAKAILNIRFLTFKSQENALGSRMQNTPRGLSSHGFAWNLEKKIQPFCKLNQPPSYLQPCRQGKGPGSYNEVLIQPDPQLDHTTNRLPIALNNVVSPQGKGNRYAR